MALRTSDDERSKIDDNYSKGSGSYLSEAERTAMDGIEDNYDQDADPSQENDNIQRTRNKESSPSWKTNVSKATKSGQSSVKGKAASFIKKRGAFVGLLGSVGVGLIVVAIFGPAAILVSLMNNLVDANDSASRAMNQRSMHVLVRNLGEADPKDKNGSGECKSYSCKKKLLSNKTLEKMNTAGIIPLDGDGKPIDFSDKKKRPTSNPKSYSINGATVSAANMADHLKNNPDVNGKLFGSKGLFNGRTSNWTGKFMKEKFRNVFGIKSDGGTADNKNKKVEAGQKKAALREKLTARLPGMSAVNDLAGSVGKYINGSNGSPGRLAAAKAGGVAYQVAYASCLASKAPSLITAAVAGNQLLRLMPFINDVVLSPAAKTQASGLDPENSVTPEDIDVAASILTERTLDKDGNMTAAVDSPLLQAALGINKNAISPSTYGEYIPGYSILNAMSTPDPITGISPREAQKAMAPACSVVMSPVTMYTWMVLETAISGANPILAGLKISGGFVVGLVAGPLFVKVVSDLAGPAIEELAKGYLEGDIEGIELGHTLGASALAFFPAGAMARFLPGLTVSDLENAATAKAEYDEWQKELDIASLSPFDTSSKHTFMGSITNSLRMNAVMNSGYNGGVMSIVGSMLRIPQWSLTPNASAQSHSFTAQQCDNAEAFDLQTEDASIRPAINAVGFPCTDLPYMDPDEAENTLINKGWVDTNIEVSDGADIQELIDKGVIKKDTPLYTLANGETGCNDASSGSYIIEAGGCTLRPVEGGQASAGSANAKETCDETCDEDGTTEASTAGRNDGDDTKAYLAMYTFLMDNQAGNSIAGDDDVADAAAPPTSSTGEQGVVGTDGFAFPVKASAGESIGVVPCPDPSGCHGSGPGSGDPAFDLIVEEGRPVFAIEDGEIIQLQQYSGTPAECMHFGIKGASGWTYWYGHIKDVTVENGATIKAGQQLAVVGPGTCTRGGSVPHLHIDRGSPKGTLEIGNMPGRDASFVPLMNSLYESLP